VGMLVRHMVGHHAISLPAYAVSCLSALPLCTHSWPKVNPKTSCHDCRPILLHALQTALGLNLQGLQHCNLTAECVGNTPVQSGWFGWLYFSSMNNKLPTDPSKQIIENISSKCTHEHWLCARLKAVGAAAQLGGVTRMTLSITVLVMEGTGALQLVVPMMLAVFVAKIVGDSVSMGVYDLHIKIRGAPVLVSAFLAFILIHSFVHLWLSLSGAFDSESCKYSQSYIQPGNLNTGNLCPDFVQKSCLTVHWVTASSLVVDQVSSACNSMICKRCRQHPVTEELLLWMVSLYGSAAHDRRMPCNGRPLWTCEKSISVSNVSNATVSLLSSACLHGSSGLHPLLKKPTCLFRLTKALNPCGEELNP